MNYKEKEALRKQKEITLLENLKKSLPELENLMTDIENEWVEADLFYRYYHQSFKVFWIQQYTQKIVEKLQSLLPDQPLNKTFLSLYNSGTGKTFEMKHNNCWHETCGPMLECYFHAKMFLHCGIKCAKVLDTPPDMLPSDWAAFLYFYNMR